MSRRSAGQAAGLACAVVLAACGGHARGSSTPAAPAGSDRAPSAPPALTAGAPGADWPMFDYDPARSGDGPASTGIGAATLAHLRRRIVRLDGTVDSAPIALHARRVRGAVRDVIVVTTTYGRTIALDAATGAVLWEFTPRDIGSYEGSSQVVTATPAADPGRAYVYAASPDGRIHKLAVASGREVRSGLWPAAVTFDPTREKIASALGVSGRYVVVTTAGYYGDAPSYQGHVVLLDRATGRRLHVFNALCSDLHRLLVPSSCGASDAGIWARAGAVVEPGTGRLLVATGNGPFDGSTRWGDSVLELSPDAATLLHNWTPDTQGRLDSGDTDLGSTAPALLGVHRGRRLAVQGGKDGELRLLDLDGLDGTRRGASPRTGGELQSIGTPGGAPLFTQPAVYSLRGRTYVAVAVDGGIAGYVLGGPPSRPRLSRAWEHGTGGTSPVLAGGLLYVFDEQGGSLLVRDPASGARLASLPAAAGHWNSPIVTGRRIILPVGNYMDHSTSGELFIWSVAAR